MQIWKRHKPSSIATILQLQTVVISVRCCHTNVSLCLIDKYTTHSTLFSPTGYSPHRLTRNTENTQSCPQMEVLRGRDGRDGRDGAKGEKGDSQTRGQKGEQGPLGSPGTQGAMGISGPQGPRGASGPQGAVGERGEGGSPGLPGPQGEQGPQGPPTGGATYIRWGNSSCPSTQDTQLVYSGRAAASHYYTKGGAANHLCLPDDPDYLQYTSGTQGYSPVTGVEYGVFPSLSIGGHNVPCALCYVASRSVAVIIPAKTHCPSNWTLEYNGYIMTEHIGHYRSMYECVDKNPESVPGLNSGSNPRALFYPVEALCNGLSCPPYDAEKELTCAVCTR